LAPDRLPVTAFKAGELVHVKAKPSAPAVSPSEIWLDEAIAELVEAAACRPSGAASGLLSIPSVQERAVERRCVVSTRTTGDLPASPPERPKPYRRTAVFALNRIAGEDANGNYP